MLFKNKRLFSAMLIMVITLLGIISKKNTVIIFEVILIIILLSLYLINNDDILFAFSIIMIMFQSLLSYYIHSIFNYTFYLVLLLMTLKIVVKKLSSRIIISNKYINIIIIILVIFNFTSTIYSNNEINILVVFYSLIKRYSYFIIFIYALNFNSGMKYYKVLTKVFVIYSLIQIPFSILQLYQGVNRDYIVGIMGNSTSSLVSQFMLLSSLLVFIYSNKKVSFYILLGCTLLFSAISEIKVMFYLIPVIGVVTNIIDKNFKNIIYLILGSVIFSAVYSYYVFLYPHQDFLGNRDFTSNYLTQNYSGSDSFNRGNYINKTNNIIFNNDGFKVLFGVGTINASSSEKEALQGYIFKMYKSTRYNWFFGSSIYVESGTIGLCIYYLLYLYIGIKAYICIIKNNDNKVYKGIFLMIITTLVLSFYSSSVIENPIFILVTWSFYSIIFSNSSNKLKNNNFALRY